MKAVVFYELGSVSMERLREVYPKHKEVIDRFAEEGKIIAVGTFANPAEGSMGIFFDKEAAADFIKNDPFVAAGFIGKITIKEWNEILLK